MTVFHDYQRVIEEREVEAMAVAPRPKGAPRSRSYGIEPRCVSPGRCAQPALTAGRKNSRGNRPGFHHFRKLSNTDQRFLFLKPIGQAFKP